MSIGDPTKIVYFVVVYGLDAESQQLFCQHFSGARGGADPTTLRIHNSVQCELPEVVNCLAWIATTLQYRYEGLCVGIGVSTPLSWANIVIPPEIMAITLKYDLELKVSFSTPPLSVQAAQHGA